MPMYNLQTVFWIVRWCWYLFYCNIRASTSYPWECYIFVFGETKSSNISNLMNLMNPILRPASVVISLSLCVNNDCVWDNQSLGMDFPIQAFFDNQNLRVIFDSGPIFVEFHFPLVTVYSPLIFYLFRLLRGLWLLSFVGRIPFSFHWSLDVHEICIFLVLHRMTLFEVGW